MRVAGTGGGCLATGLHSNCTVKGEDTDTGTVKVSVIATARVRVRYIDRIRLRGRLSVAWWALRVRFRLKLG